MSELLPNPAGTDSGHEFIELHNPTEEVIPLAGCSLTATDNSKTYNFSATAELQPGEYQAFSDNMTGLTLANAAGGTVRFSSPTAELQAVTYPGNLDDDVSWARFVDDWQSTYQLTPNAPNVLVSSKPCPVGEERNPDTGLCRSLTTGESSSILTPCREDQERNPETNRCRSLQSTVLASLVPCKPGQERNPATNRCRSIAGSASNLVPCKEGQERNPETNRCRSVATAASSLKPCEEGQERNPATNRCRKAAGGNTKGLATVKDVPTGSIANHTKWLIAGLAVLGAIGYGAYEWRRPILTFFSGLRAKLPW